MPPPRQSSFVRHPRPSFVIPDSDQGTLPLVVPAEAGTQVQGAGCPWYVIPDPPNSVVPDTDGRPTTNRHTVLHPHPTPKLSFRAKPRNLNRPSTTPPIPPSNRNPPRTVIPDPIRNPGAGRGYHPKHPVLTATHDTQHRK